MVDIRNIPEPARTGPEIASPARGKFCRGIYQHQHGCSSCHVIPGVTGADVHVGPPLRGIESRRRIAGQLASPPEQMLRWIRDPKSIDPLTAVRAGRCRRAGCARHGDEPGAPALN